MRRIQVQRPSMKPMKHFPLRTLVSLLALCAPPTAPLGLAQDTLDSLLGRLSDKPLNHAVLWKIEAQPPDPRTIPALEAAFAKRQTKEEKQWIAASLLRLGDRSDVYFDFLAGYAKEAVDDRTPFFEQFDRNGKSVSGQFSAEFENWCALNHKDPKQVAGIQFGVYPVDVLTLAEVGDQRATELFKRGLESPNPGVVAYSAQGLGRLNVLSAIPLISEAFNRLPSGDRTIVAAQLPWYAGGEAEQLFEHLVPGTALREFWRSTVRRQRDQEMKCVLSREGRRVPK